MLVDEERVRIVVEVAVDFHSVGALHIGRHYRVALSIPVRGILRYLLCLLQFRREWNGKPSTIGEDSEFIYLDLFLAVSRKAGQCGQPCVA